MKIWQFVLLIIAVAAMSSSYAYSMRPQELTKTVYVPVCDKLPVKHSIMIKMLELKR